jgi:hypothetical protein
VGVRSGGEAAPRMAARTHEAPFPMSLGMK